MSFELDHLFVCVSEEAPEADRLIEFGLTEGPRNTHPGQGTANRRFFFQNGMIELVWLQDEAEAKTALVTTTRLFERLHHRQTAASPFGLVFRPARQGESRLPFDCWEYRPPYLPAGMSFYIGENSTIIEEPFLAYIPFRVGAEEYLAHLKPYLDHNAGFRDITSVIITTPEPKPISAAFDAAKNLGCVSFIGGDDHLTEVEFDSGEEGRTIDFRPDLPLVFHW
jgi:hypothetical protein